jgi:hypothetical protein
MNLIIHHKRIEKKIRVNDNLVQKKAGIGLEPRARTKWDSLFILGWIWTEGWRN